MTSTKGKASCISCRTTVGASSHFRFPKDPHKYNQWLESLNLRKSDVSATSRICNNHFKSDDFKTCGKGRRLLLKENAIPQYIPPTTRPSTDNCELKTSSSSSRFCFICGNGKGFPENVKYFRFPSDPSRKLQWLTVCDIEPLSNVNNLFLCSRHFLQPDIIQKGNSKWYLTNSALPVLHLSKTSKTRIGVSCKYCCICKATGVGTSDFCFPKNKALSLRWLKACHLDPATNVSKYYVCNIHFDEHDFSNDVKLGRKIRLKKDAVPHRNLGYKNIARNDSFLSESPTTSNSTPRNVITDISIIHTQSGSPHQIGMQNDSPEDKIFEESAINGSTQNRLGDVFMEVKIQSDSFQVGVMSTSVSSPHRINSAVDASDTNSIMNMPCHVPVSTSTQTFPQINSDSNSSTNMPCPTSVSTSPQIPQHINSDLHSNTNMPNPIPLTQHINLEHKYSSPANKTPLQPRFPGDVSNLFIETVTPNHARKCLRMQRAHINKLRKNVSRLQQSLRRAKKKIETLENLIQQLKSSYYLS